MPIIYNKALYLPSPKVSEKKQGPSIEGPDQLIVRKIRSATPGEFFQWQEFTIDYVGTQPAASLQSNSWNWRSRLKNRPEDERVPPALNRQLGVISSKRIHTLKDLQIIDLLVHHTRGVETAHLSYCN